MDLPRCSQSAEGLTQLRYCVWSVLKPEKKPDTITFSAVILQGLRGDVGVFICALERNRRETISTFYFAESLLCCHERHSLSSFTVYLDQPPPLSRAGEEGSPQNPILPILQK